MGIKMYCIDFERFQLSEAQYSICKLRSEILKTQ